MGDAGNSNPDKRVAEAMNSDLPERLDQLARELTLLAEDLRAQLAQPRKRVGFRQNRGAWIALAVLVAVAFIRSVPGFLRIFHHIASP